MEDCDSGKAIDIEFEQHNSEKNYNYLVVDMPGKGMSFIDVDAANKNDAYLGKKIINKPQCNNGKITDE